MRCSGFEELTLSCLEDVLESATGSDNALSMSTAMGLEGRERYHSTSQITVMRSSPLPTKETYFLNPVSCFHSLGSSSPRYLERADFIHCLHLLDPHPLLNRSCGF